GLLPDGLGGVLWRLLSTALYLSALYWWGRAMMQPRSLVPFGKRGSQGAAIRDRTWLALLFLLTIPLSLDNLHNRQSKVLMIAVIMLGVLACGSGYWKCAAACMAIACLFKVYPIAVALLLAVVYPRRFAGRFAVALGIGLLLPFLLQRPGYVLEQYTSW